MTSAAAIRGEMTGFVSGWKWRTFSFQERPPPAGRFVIRERIALYQRHLFRWCFICISSRVLNLSPSFSSLLQLPRLHPFRSFSPQIISTLIIRHPIPASSMMHRTNIPKPAAQGYQPFKWWMPQSIPKVPRARVSWSLERRACNDLWGALADLNIFLWIISDRRGTSFWGWWWS